MEEFVLKNVWGFLFVLACGGFFYLLGKWIGRVDKSIERITEGFIELTKIGAKHDTRLDNVEERQAFYEQQLMSKRK